MRIIREINSKVWSKKICSSLDLQQRVLFNREILRKRMKRRKDCIIFSGCMSLIIAKVEYNAEEKDSILPIFHKERSKSKRSIKELKSIRNQRVRNLISALINAHAITWELPTKTSPRSNNSSKRKQNKYNNKESDKSNSNLRNKR